MIGQHLMSGWWVGTCLLQLQNAKKYPITPCLLVNYLTAIYNSIGAIPETMSAPSFALIYYRAAAKASFSCQ
jgi:hypothetical protein